jgi:glucose/arabinose dehydrogenase/cytochrome c5
MTKTKPKNTKTVKLSSKLKFLLIVGISCLFSCTSNSKWEGQWDVTLQVAPDEISHAKILLNQEGSSYQGRIVSYDLGAIWDYGTKELDSLRVQGDSLTANFRLFGRTADLKVRFADESLSGTLITRRGDFPVSARRWPEDYAPDNSANDIKYTLADADLSDYEHKLDHAGMIASSEIDAYTRGMRTYNNNCINCHGIPGIEGSIPLSLKFWEQPFKAGNDPFSMYQTITKGYGSMPPQVTLTPQEKYDVIFYIRENYMRSDNAQEYFMVNDAYLASLPEGDTTGPAVKPYHPWSDMDYGNFFINTYELVDSVNGPERFHSPGPAPYPDENYLENNFAYKGIAVRLDEGEGGVSDGKAWMIFDHDVMRVAGGWTGEGFIDWEGILLNDRHETYPRTIGKLHFETPLGPGWANPSNGSYKDPRFVARDGRAFGPLPKKWANYKGLYRSGEHIVISYSVGDADILEELGMEKNGDEVVFTRTLNISPSAQILQMRVAPDTARVALSGTGASLSVEDGYTVLNVDKGKAARLKLFMAAPGEESLDTFAQNAAAPESLAQYTRGGVPKYEQELTTLITRGDEDGPIAVDQLTPPYENPWDSRMKLSGIDFMQDANTAVVCTTDGDIWKITGLTEQSGRLTWRRIAAGLFQPLGIKVLDEKIYVTCRDQLVRLQDLNGDGETDFYESFNHDHQVTDHFHEFAMGLQADEEGNLYYAKSGRHAREALIPQHGTLLKVSKDGSSTEIIATGFRAANGVCLNPDGSFIVTDQQGFWNPMNRVNWVDGEGKFYGNMWGYNPPEDTSRAAMVPPLAWVDMDFDRSPSELLWVDSEEWGPLNGSLLSLSYGYGKVQLVFNEKVKGQMQGGVVDIPGIKFMTGVMRGRFNPDDGQLYACGMSAWGTNQMMKGGGLYRLRYTGKPLPIPLELSAEEDGMRLSFAEELDPETTTNTANYSVKTWRLVRSSKYGSDRYDKQELAITEAILGEDGKSVKLVLPGIAPVDVMTIDYDVTDTQGNPMKGILQNTIHKLKEGSGHELLSRKD